MYIYAGGAGEGGIEGEEEGMRVSLTEDNGRAEKAACPGGEEHQLSLHQHRYDPLMVSPKGTYFCTPLRTQHFKRSMVDRSLAREL